MDIRNFQFADGVEVPTAADPKVAVAISKGVWPVAFDDFTSHADNDSSSECEVRDGREQITVRMLRTTLDDLCARGLAKAR